MTRIFSFLLLFMFFTYLSAPKAAVARMKGAD